MEKPKNNFSLNLANIENVVLPQDLYFEIADNTRNIFGLYDYLPFIRTGELEHLLSLIYNSPTAQSICNKVAAYTVGEGFYLKKERSILGDKKLQELTDQEKTILWRILKRKNSDGDCLLDVCRKAAFDYQATGNAFAQLDVIAGVTFITHQNINFVRPFRSTDLKTRFFGVSADWAILPFQTTGRNPQRQDSITANIVDVPLYPTFTAELQDVEESEYGIGANVAEFYGFDKSSMLHVKRYAPLMYQWGLPSWTGAKHWVELEYRIPKFNVSRFKNGLTSSGLLQLFGNLTDDEKDAYQKAFTEKMTNTGNDFKVILQILEDKELKANWQPFENTYTGYFMELANLAKELIATGFEIPLSLVQATAGQLGNNQQIRTEFETLYRTKIYDIQEAILRGVVMPYLETVAENEGLDWLRDIELGFTNIIPVSFSGDLAIENFLTTNEGRELLGYPELTEPLPTAEPAPEQPATGLVNRFRNLFKRK
jgi:hypothetical protein